jgi:hypothetical protein
MYSRFSKNRVPDEYTKMLIDIIEDDNATVYNFINVFESNLLDIPTITILFYKCINRNKYIGKLFKQKIEHIHNYQEIMDKMETYIQSNMSTCLNLFNEELEIWNDANPERLWGE